MVRERRGKRKSRKWGGGGTKRKGEGKEGGSLC